MNQRFRFSIADLFVAAVIASAFVVANLYQRDMGFGVHLFLQGWPFLAATYHSLNGITIHWYGVLANVFTGVAIVGIATMIVGKLRRLLVQKTESRSTHEIGE